MLFLLSASRALAGLWSLYASVLDLKLASQSSSLSKSSGVFDRLTSPFSSLVQHRHHLSLHSITEYKVDLLLYIVSFVLYNSCFQNRSTWSFQRLGKCFEMSRNALVTDLWEQLLIPLSGIAYLLCQLARDTATLADILLLGVDYSSVPLFPCLLRHTTERPPFLRLFHLHFHDAQACVTVSILTLPPTCCFLFYVFSIYQYIVATCIIT